MSSHMPAAVFTGRRVELRRLSVPKLQDITAPKKYGDGTVTFRKEDLVLLRVEGASICGTDLHILEGTHGSAPPVILGHEYVGQVVAVGPSVEHVHVGDRVAVDPNIKCGYCTHCVQGRPNLCMNLTTLGIFLDGGFASFNVAPARQLFVLPSDLSTERAVFFEPFSCVLHGMEKVHFRSGESALVFGAGPIGCLFVAFLRAAGASEIFVVEPRRYRRKFAQALGATAVDSENVVEELGKDTMDVVIDASGYRGMLPAAIEVTRPNGRILLFGQQNTRARININPTVANQKELQIFGSYAAASSFAQTVKLLGNPALELEKLITHRFDLRDIKKAFRLLETQRGLEVIVVPEET